MEAPILDFAGRLRKTGIKVSTAELMDAFETLAHLNLEDKSVFKAAFRATLIKRARDIPVFDELFDLHFFGGPRLGSAPEEREDQPQKELPVHASEPHETRRSDLSPVTEMIMSGRFGALTRLMLDRSQDLALKRMEIPPISGSFFLGRFKRVMELDRVRLETEQILAEMQDRGLDPAEIQAMREYMDRNIDRLEREIENLIQNEVDKSRFLSLRRLMDEDLTDRDLFRLSEEDFLAMRPAVERLARRLKERLSLRLRWADTGRFDIKTTLRKNIGYGGPLPDLRFRNKRPARPQVLALCDVSRSVRDFSRFMLLFLYTLKEVIARIRSFIFVGDLTEVTLLFQQHDLNEAVSLAAAGHGLTYPFGTDYGASLSQFTDQHLSAINSKTTVIILGDARNNNLHPRTEALEAMADRAKKMIWLNPEPRSYWGLGDSVMHLYKPYCTKVTECSTLKQLSTIVEENLIP